jgi:CRP/FNR family transcriptional regulator, nitrogen oxide reductase regulator
MPAVCPEVVTGLLGPTAWTRTLQAGETLFLEGENPTAVYQVLGGFVKLTWATPGGRETISELLLPGDVFDLPSAFDGCPYPLTCKAPSNSTATLAVVSRGALLEDPQLGWRCQVRLVQQLRQQRSHPVATAAERVEVRIGRALLWLADSLGTRSGSGVTFPLWLTRQEIAEWVGTTTETVIRVCSDLKRRGLIELSKGHVTLVNAHAILELTEAA